MNYTNEIPPKKLHKAYCTKQIGQRNCVNNCTKKVSIGITFFLVGEPELNIWLCVVSVCVCGVCVVSPGWMRCSDRAERKEKYTITISVYSTCVHTSVGTAKTWIEQEFWHERRHCMGNQNYYLRYFKSDFDAVKSKFGLLIE